MLNSCLLSFTNMRSKSEWRLLGQGLWSNLLYYLHINYAIAVLSFSSAWLIVFAFQKVGWNVRWMKCPHRFGSWVSDIEHNSKLWLTYSLFSCSIRSRRLPELFSICKIAQIQCYSLSCCFWVQLFSEWVWDNFSPRGFTPCFHTWFSHLFWGSEIELRCFFWSASTYLIKLHLQTRKY